MNEISLSLWKEELKKIKIYTPDRPQSGPNAPFPHGFNHETYIAFLCTAVRSFKRLTEHMTWDQRVNFQHEEYLDII
jgi:hypothetical protein